MSLVQIFGASSCPHLLARHLAIRLLREWSRLVLLWAGLVILADYREHPMLELISANPFPLARLHEDARLWFSRWVLHFHGIWLRELHLV